MGSQIDRLYETYSGIYEHLKYFQEQYKEAERHLEEFKVEDEAVRQARIENFNKQLEDIGGYYARVEYFRQLAEKNITSKNILSLKALELDFNSLRHDAARIDHLNPNDPYAYRLYVHTRCNEIYLEEKQKEFEAKREQLLNGNNAALEEMKVRVKKAKEKIEADCEAYILGEEFTKFANKVRDIHRKYDFELYEDFGLQGSRDYESKDKVLSFGMRAQPLPLVGERANASALKVLSEGNGKGVYYDVNSRSILLPVEYDFSREVCIYVRVSAAKANRCFKGINNLLINRIKRTKPGERNLKIHFIDALHFNNSELRALKPLENSNVIEKVPQSMETIDEVLAHMIAEFSDIDELLQDYETVEEYNADPDNEEKLIEKKILVLVGYPNAFSENARKCIERIIYNHQRYGIMMIIVENTGYDNGRGKNDLLNASNDFYYIDMPVGSSSTISWKDKEKLGFRWYEYDYKHHPIPQSYIDEIRLDDDKHNRKSTVYIKNFPMDKWKYHERSDKERRRITLPYGIDGKDEIKSISFNDDNFAAYLMGASGSGKSTLLHTLITGILRNYHPDDVELWLADFKMAEFSQYIDPMPPHVKYILLDESDELVYDLVDKLTEKMYERQNFFMEATKKRKGYKNVNDLPSDVYMPTIFVILDEFSIMSQVLQNSDVYKLKLQNILAKGRALGIKFIFASQSYLNGIQGLTATAKEQIQSRIAMKNNDEEIQTTLELPSFLKTEENRYWIATLPKYMALRKYIEKKSEEDEARLVLERTKVMYFEGEEDRYKPQREMIEDIIGNLDKVSKYNSESNNTYVDKNPVVVDGNSYEAFNLKTVTENIKEIKKAQKENLNGDEILILPGRPRLMSNVKEIVITPEARQNFLLIANSVERRCAASIITSAMNSFKSQSKDVEIWGYDRNLMVKNYAGTEWKDIKILSGLDDICEAIKRTRNSLEKRESNEDKLIVLIGFENLCIEFGYLNSTQTNNAQEIQTITAEESGIDEEDFEALIHFDDDPEGLFDDIDIDDLSANSSEQSIKFDNSSEDGTVDTSKLYNASEDLKYIVKMGSRQKIHFLLSVNSLSDLKQTGINIDEFVHRVSFAMSKDEAYMVFPSGSSSGVARMPEHVCMYTDTMQVFSFRPYIHENITWDGWKIQNGKATNLKEE